MSNNKIRGTLRSYLRWPLLLGILLILMNLQIYLISLKAALIMSAYVAIYLIIAVLLYYFKRGALLHDLVDYSMRFHVTVNTVASELDIPVAIIGPDFRCIWENKQFHKRFSPGKKRKYHITDAIPALVEESFPVSTDTNGEMHFHNEETYYKAVLQRIELEDAPEETRTGAGEIGIGSTLYAIFVYDETEIVHYIRENYDQRLDVGLLYIDNYDEALEDVEEVRTSLLVALIERKINKYFNAYDGIVRKLEKDRFFVVMKEKALSQIRENKFDLLQDIKTVNIGNEMAVTISIGMGLNGLSYAQNYEFARNAIDIALGRGGDQAVVKIPENVIYYGGKSQQMEKSTRVKARVKAHALREIISVKDEVYVMGHRMGDVDSFGASVGIYRIAEALDKKAHIVLNDVTSSMQPMVEMFRDNDDYAEDMIINSQLALETVGNNAVLVVVDVNRPSITEAPELLRMVKTIVVLDHHRQSSEIINNAVLSYVEPYASSACEMVAEVLQYIADDIKIKPQEADTMYAGIVIDTNNFNNQAGVRTFEAAAYLRRCGADIARVRKMLREEMADHKAKAEAVSQADVYQGAFAISVCPSEGIENPTIVAAQAANELLEIKGIKASVVMSKYNNTIYLSRST